MRTCPNCGISIITLELTHKTGCPFCYEYFKNEIQALNGGMESNDSFVVHPSEMKESLIQSLQQAVEQEKYEEAARIRDRINAAEMDVDSYPNQ